MSFRNFTPAGAAFCLLLSGCGGSSSTPSTTPDGDSSPGDSILTGVFIDSPVEGLAFATETQSGTTNATGEFSYLAGEQVTFSIGAAQFPAVAATARVTPVDIAAGSATAAAMTTNIARLLQSLDQDGNPANGITISSSAAASATELNFDVSTEEFENNAEVINLVANSGSVITSLISAEDANSHLNSTLGTESTSNVVTDGRITTFEQYTATLVGNTVVGRNDDGSRDESTRLISTSDMKTTGTFRGESTNLDWYWEEEFYCRSGQSGNVTVELDCQVVTISGGIVTFTEERGAGGSNSYFIENGAETETFSISDLISGSPWYAIRVYDGRQECGNSYSFAADGSLSAESNGGTITGTYTLSDAGSLGLDTVQFGIETRKLNALNQLEWSSNSVNNSGGEYLERAFSSRDAALEFANSLGTDCESELPV